MKTKGAHHKKHDVCRICKNGNLVAFLDLGEQPLANSFLKKEDLHKPEAHYPLEVCFCPECHLVQLTNVVDKEVLFRDYIYFSSGMPKLSNHFEQYAKDLMRDHVQPGDFIVELASNDGILLKFFKDSGYRVLGIDPATNVVATAENMGVLTLNDFFSAELARKIAAEHGKANAIMANNVVAHIDDHHDLAEGISILLADDGVFVFEAPYLTDMFDNLAYDTIYHEHLSFLAVRPLQKLFEQYGLEMFDVKVVPVQGNSLRGFVGKKGAHALAPSVRKSIEREVELGMHELETYHELAKRIRASKEKLLATLKKFKSEGKTIAAYGAPAKGNTLLNYCGIGIDVIDFALEDSAYKRGFFTPGMHIPVVSREYAESHLPDVYVMLAWNYAKVILEKERGYLENGGKFVIPIGDIEII